MTASRKANSHSGAAGCTVRRATIADAAMLAASGARMFRDAFSADNSPADMDAYVAHAYGLEQQRAELSQPGATFLIAEIAGEPAGYAFLRAAPLPAHVVGAKEEGSRATTEIARFYVDSAFHGKGVAQELMNAAIVEARHRSATAVWLGVWERNARAISFYSKHGFHDIGSQPFVLGTDLQTDRVMTRPV